MIMVNIRVITYIYEMP